MEKQKRWQLFLILTVIILTIYNILPTVFFYTKPLNQPILEKRGNEIALQIADRTNELAENSVDWLHSFCKNLRIKPISILIDKDNPELIHATFSSLSDANAMRAYLPRAGSLISFVPSQLSIQGDDEFSKTVTIQRKISVLFDPNELNQFFTFAPKINNQGSISNLYRTIVEDRVQQILTQIGSTSENAQYLITIVDNAKNPEVQDLLLHVSHNIINFSKAYGENSSISQRYFASFTQSDRTDRSDTVRKFISALETCKDRIKLERISLEEKKTAASEGNFLNTIDQQRVEQLDSQERVLNDSLRIVKAHSGQFASGKKPFSYDSIKALLIESALKVSPEKNLQTIFLEDRDPFIKNLVIDWNNQKVFFDLQSDFLAYQGKLERDSYVKDLSDQMLFDEIAYISRETGETISPQGEEFVIQLNELSNSKTFLTLNLSAVAQKEINQVKKSLYTAWNPKHTDLQKNTFPIWDYETYLGLSFQQQKLGFVVYAPVMQNTQPMKGFKPGSVYVIAKGLQKILEKSKTAADSPETAEFFQDFQGLRQLMQQNGFYGYPGAVLSYTNEFKDDYIFENADYFQNLLKATREDFSVHGTKRYAVLEFSNVEQRILTENKIDTLQHEDLLKWRDDYNAAQIGIKGVSAFDVPPPTKSPFLNNLKISSIKYFRGDDRKILKWGLDLSGGKTIQIQLRDNNNRVVSNPADIQQGINELYKRVNKMGVSEVSIRQERDLITLDFPGAQNISANDLVKASTMFFHVVNEKFSSNNTALAPYIERFLQEIWNEAVVTGKKEAIDINRIAWKHLYGSSLEQESAQPRTEAAEKLIQSGLRLANPDDTPKSSAFNDAFSSVAVMKGNDFADWQGQSSPLLIVFHNYALEGSSLDNVRANYDPSKGNFLSFEVKGSYTNRENQKTSPRSDLFAWTSQFSKEKITGTSNDKYSQGRGWRMAVILNGLVISSPTLDSALRDNASITGSFSQREINQLEADLKAGSLSFTPQILSEKNISPEIGSKERTNSILATFLAVALVVVVMMGYYRFGGMVASIAVIFNLLIMWAALQNMQATITLAGIAGIILTIGMAVDANVLVFERIREEFTATGRIASAVNAGYRKAFSAIFDSNITTIIAALILLQFDSGPIKGFAVTLIIGIASSMFTSLFMTRYFFAGWVKNPQNKQLSMANFISSRKFDFMRYAKPAFWFSAIIILIGAYVFSVEKSKIMGMDFTGGFSLTLELEPNANQNYRQVVEKALVSAGISENDFQIQELSPANQLRIFLSRNLEKQGKAFYVAMPPISTEEEFGYSYEDNPKIVWIVNALQKNGIHIPENSLEKLDQNWSAISGQMSSTMRNAAILGLAIAILCIMAYITIRFEFKYAVSATICIAHDVIFTVACIGILHLLGVPLQIDLHTIAALLTIVGYSLNDTIIVFDRIREDMKHLRKLSFRDIINHALNTTLSRTMLTSGTTLLVLIPLVAFGGSTIFGFALVMVIGVIFGTLSSLFIASPLLLYFHNKEIDKRNVVLSE